MYFIKITFSTSIIQITVSISTGVTGPYTRYQKYHG